MICFLPQGVIPLGGCVVSASEDLGMPFAIVIDLEDFTVRTQPVHHSSALRRFEILFLRRAWAQSKQQIWQHIIDLKI